MNPEVKNVDAIVILNYGTWVDRLFFYFAPLQSGVFEHSAVIVTPNDKTLLTSKLEYETAKSELEGVECFHYESISQLLPNLANLLKKYSTIGLNYDGLPHSTFLQLNNLLNHNQKKYKFKDVSSELAATRLIKSKEEQEKIRTACKISVEVAEEIPIYQHSDEQTVAAHIEFNLRKRGATGIAFSTIAAFGPNSADPHYTSGKRKAKSGEFLLTDFGAEYARYKSDITRTFIFDKADSRAIHLYELVLQAQQEALDAIHAGVPAKEIDAIARNIIEKQHPKRFIHSLGHSLGLETHDGGRMGPSTELILEEGMILTVEPGVYLRDYGGVRIEDDILVTKNGYELLTTAKKDELIEIPL